MTYRIIFDKFFFRVENTVTGWRSSVVTSAGQAGLMIFRKAGQEAYDAAMADFAVTGGK